MYDVHSPVATARMISIISSVRAPRVFIEVPVNSNSSGIHDSPTPSVNRSPDSAAIDATCFATSSGCRIGSFTTLVTKRIRDVTAAIAGTATNGSTNGVSAAQKRSPSGTYG